MGQVMIGGEHFETMGDTAGTPADPHTIKFGGTMTATESQVVADNAAFTDGTTKVFMAGMIFDETPGTALTENDAAAPRIDSKRAQVLTIEDATTRGQRASVNAAGALLTADAGPSQTMSFGVSSAAVVSADMTSAAALTAAPTAGQKLVIVDIVASSDTAMNILFEEETSGTDIFKVFVPANGTVQITPRGKIKLATADKKLTGKASVAGNVAFTVTYYSEA